MRRPVKPFVTEYRGGSRRPSGQGSGPGLDLFKTEPAPSAAPSSPSPSPWAPPPAQAEPEDGYDAALRAADALFSGARPAPAAPAASTPSAPSGESAKPAAPGAGRILRVLDEPPSADMLEMQRLEAEHAPKKRGRKPGSKNKPKVAALVAEPVETATPPTLPEADAPAAPDASVAAALAARAIAAAPRKSEATAPNERYAWVRTRLKPGQQWKRRLPKVAW